MTVVSIYLLYVFRMVFGVQRVGMTSIIPSVIDCCFNALHADIKLPFFE